MVPTRTAARSARGRARLVTAAAAALLAGAILLAMLRVTSLGSIGGIRLGTGAAAMSDFKSTVYYPAKAFADGVNPYDTQEYLDRYPAPEPLRLYPPATLLIFQPFAWLPLEAAMGVQAILTVLLSGVLAYVSLRLARVRVTATAVLAIWGLMLLSRPGQWNLIQGQMTLLMVLGVYAALAAGPASPVIGGLGLALSLLKPNFGIPAAALMVARGHSAGAAIGVGLAGVLNLVALGALIDHPGAIYEFGQRFLGTGDQLRFSARLGTELSVFRIDGGGLVTRWLGVHLGAAGSLILCAVIVGLVMALLARRRPSHPVEGPPAAPVAGLLCCTVLISMYHIGYDLLLLTWPFVALVKGLRASPRLVPFGRWVQAGLYALLAMNYVTTFSVLSALHAHGALFMVVASLNGAALAALFVLYFRDVVELRRAAVRSSMPLVTSTPSSVGSS